MTVTEQVFRWSNPIIPNAKPWRVADAHQMRSVLSDMGYDSTAVYVEHDGVAGLHVGLRDNRVKFLHSGRVEVLCDRLVKAGFKASLKMEGEFAWAVAVIDG